MKTIKLLSILSIFIAFSSCNDTEDPIILPVASKTVTNLHAPQTSDYTTNPPTTTGDYVRFSFLSGTTVTGDDWDIAFRGTTILVNGGSKKLDDEWMRTGKGGAYIANETLAGVAEVDATLFTQDASSGLAISGWYSYNPATHIITAIAGKVIIIKTHDGKYAKMEILSYYKDGDTSSDSRYYTFKYVYQPNEGETTF